MTDQLSLRMRGFLMELVADVDRAASPVSAFNQGSVGRLRELTEAENRVLRAVRDWLTDSAKHGWSQGGNLLRHQLHAMDPAQ